MRTKTSTRMLSSRCKVLPQTCIDSEQKPRWWPRHKGAIVGLKTLAREGHDARETVGAGLHGLSADHEQQCAVCVGYEPALPTVRHVHRIQLAYRPDHMIEGFSRGLRGFKYMYTCIEWDTGCDRRSRLQAGHRVQLAFAKFRWTCNRVMSRAKLDAKKWTNKGKTRVDGGQGGIHVRKGAQW